MTSEQQGSETMAQVSVMIGGKTYRMACDDGQEAYLAGLAERLNVAIARLRERFGEIGDQRLNVMAAITFADQYAEAEERLQRFQAEITRLEGEANAIAERQAAIDAGVADGINAIAEGIEALAARMAGGKTQ